MIELRPGERYEYGARFRPAGPVNIVDSSDAQVLQADRRAIVFRRVVRERYVRSANPGVIVVSEWSVLP